VLCLLHGFIQYCLFLTAALRASEVLIYCLESQIQQFLSRYVPSLCKVLLQYFLSLSAPRLMWSSPICPVTTAVYTRTQKKHLGEQKTWLVFLSAFPRIQKILLPNEKCSSNLKKALCQSFLFHLELVLSPLSWLVHAHLVVSSLFGFV